MIDHIVDVIKASRKRPDYRHSVVQDLLQALWDAGYTQEDIQRLTADRLRQIKSEVAASTTKRERNEWGR